MSGALADALLELPALYRDVLQAHLYDGKRAVEIAREFERAPGTVRLQILRGLELLRRALPPGLATGLALIASEGRGLASVKAAVVEKAALVAPALAGAALASPLVLGGLAIRPWVRSRCACSGRAAARPTRSSSCGTACFA